MSDQIVIKDLLLRTIIGINDEERVNRQDVLINLTLDTDCRKAGKSDEIDDAVNYRSLTKKIIQLVESSQYKLVEALAEKIAQTCLAFKGVTQVSVCVEKPGALRFANSVGVCITRDQSDVASQ
ncbi:D-erythro-7,8-dihydroneopterin triphosphate epimerase [Polystyrenella longa]|uniref:7,8-dihydroneopterin aldolase n=1 Tax=Polystyrenella longa TaxID=2528007 RepID=A0A518CII2_9PLAN|nr:dihydroneopterin aldolase [Polystyrenella longa]QDU79007.1 D-erythro-7,8-dihydroneopterin triphosphate epimerase [Polystyrenella longa]